MFLQRLQEDIHKYLHVHKRPTQKTDKIRKKIFSPPITGNGQSAELILNPYSYVKMQQLGLTFENP